MVSIHGEKSVDVNRVSRVRVWRRPRLGWMDGVKVALGSSEITVEVARQSAKDAKGVQSPGAYVND